MKVFKTLPNDGEFFRIYAKFATGIAAGVVVSQIISALTEAGIIYQAIYQSLEIFGPQIALIGAVAGAALGVAMIELVGLRFFLPQSVDAVLFRRFAGLHLPMTLFSFVMATALIAGSFLLSIEGKADLVDSALNTAEQNELAAAEDDHEEIRAGTLADFRRDSATLADQYAGLIEAERAKAAAVVEVHRNDLELWEGKQTRTGRNYESRISRANGGIKAAEADLKAAEAKFKTELTARIQQRETRYVAAADSLQSVLAGTLADMGSDYETKGQRYGMGAGLIVILAVSFSFIGIILNRIFRKGAGIEETPIPTDYYFRPGVLSEWYYALSERLQQLTRQGITNFISRTKEPPELSRIHALYERDKIKQPRRPIGYHRKGETDSSVITEPLEADKLEKSHAPTHGGMKAKNCLQCGFEYIPKVSWQKYCSTECKDAFHASKHGGKRFNPSKYHRTKS